MMDAFPDMRMIKIVVDIENEGRHSLALITQMARITGGENIIIIAWNTPSKCLSFTIDGKNSASPDRLAKALEIALDYQKGRHKARGKDPFYWWG